MNVGNQHTDSNAKFGLLTLERQQETSQKAVNTAGGHFLRSRLLANIRKVVIGTSPMTVSQNSPICLLNVCVAPMDKLDSLS